MSEGNSERGGDRRRAFTLVEVLVVIALIVTLAGLVLGVMSGVQRRAEVARAEGELAVLAQALEQYRAAYGDYPWVLRHAVEGDDALINSQRLYQALMGHRSPIGDKVLRGGVLQVREDPLASSAPAERRSFVNPGDLTVGKGGEIISPQSTPDFSMAGSFFEQCFYDPWGHPYLYLYRAESSPSAWRSPGFVLFSLGPDGEAGSVDGALPVAADGRRTTGNPDNGAADNVYHAQP